MGNIANKRVDFLDGLRGWAAFIVLFCHLYQSWLYPPGQYPFSELFYGSTVRLFVDGASAVSLFFLISSFALSFNFFMTSNYRSLLATAQFRYLRLFIPIFCSVYLTYILIKLGLLYSVQGGVGVYMNKLHFKPLLQYCAYDVFFKASPHHNDYGPQLWTMSVEFIGSFMVFAILGLVGMWKFRYFVYLSLIPFLYGKFYSYYFLFLVGLFLSDFCASIRKDPNFIENSYLGPIFYLIKEKKSFQILMKFFYFLGSKYRFDLIMLGIFICLYQVQMVDQSKPIFPMIFFFVWTLSSTNLKTFFSSKLSRFLGRISFSLYLTHFLILCSLPRYLYVVLKDAGYALLDISLIVSFISIPMSIALAYLFTVVVEENLLKRIKAWLVKIEFIRDSKSSLPAIADNAEILSPSK